MTGSLEKSALILSVGFVVGIIILTGSIKKNTLKLSKSIEEAGRASRSSYSASFPSSLHIQTTEAAKDLTLDRKKQLADAFIAACIGQVYQEKKIQQVEIKRFNSQSLGARLNLRGNLIFEDGSIYENFDSILSSDGFGGYEGFVRTANGSNSIISTVNIQ
ncbi:MAG: hypothetical protein JW787_11260 [Sedimentisphaerales bacterium]|nr:hypothetical protein [Sedimentisphaerales bacterium]